MQQRRSYKSPLIVITISGLLAIACLAALLVLWGLFTSADASVWSETIGQLLTWLNIEHDIGKENSGVSVWIWILSACLGALASLSIVVFTIGLIWLIIIALRQPNVRYHGQRGMQTSKELSTKGWRQSKTLSWQGLKQGEKISKDLQRRWNNRNKS